MTSVIEDLINQKEGQPAPNRPAGRDMKPENQEESTAPGKQASELNKSDVSPPPKDSAESEAEELLPLTERVKKTANARVVHKGKQIKG
jgi:hypothetical protein